MADTAESVVLHAVGATGCSQRKTIGWRRHYAAPDNGPAFEACEDAVARGWMKKGASRKWMLSVPYIVTDDGVRWASKHTGRRIDKDAGMKTEKPILFSGPLVRAILEGRKTETRRIIKPAFWKGLNPEKFGPGVTSPDGRWKSPYGERGDELWVRETFYCDDFDYPRGDVEEMRKLLTFRADHDCASWEAGCPCSDDEGRSSWRPSIHMPRWASRIQLRVVEVRFERLQDIDGDGARAEGIESHDDDGVTYYGPFDHGHADPRVAFRQLWDGINAKRGFGWNVNPWVWVIRFEVMP